MTPSKLVEQADMPTHQERRKSDRLPFIESCPYELSSFPGGDEVELSHGHAVSVNISAGGMLFLMPQVPGERQVFQVLAPSMTRQEATTKLVEVRWTRQVRIGVEASLHLVGIRFLFEPPSTP